MSHERAENPTPGVTAKTREAPLIGDETYKPSVFAMMFFWISEVPP
jgi:hypothetical protein